MKDREA